MSGGFVLLPEPYIQEVIRCTVTGISIKLCSERTMAYLVPGLKVQEASTRLKEKLPVSSQQEKKY